MEKFYGHFLNDLKTIMNLIEIDLKTLDFVEHLSYRIKKPDSVIAKLQKKGKEETVAEAFNNLNDIIGLRTVVRFTDDVYKVLDYIFDKYEVLNIKDYIKSPKENGYRSLHVIVKIVYCDFSLPVEIQIRTISQDAWASLEHKMKYKKKVAHVKLISSELKRCADEMASIDLSMQAIKDMIMIEN